MIRNCKKLANRSNGEEAILTKSHAPFLSHLMGNHIYADDVYTKENKV